MNEAGHASLLPTYHWPELSLKPNYKKLGNIDYLCAQEKERKWFISKHSSLCHIIVFLAKSNF